MYRKEELLLIWLDSFIGLEYRHKAKLYEDLRLTDGILKTLKDKREVIESDIGENEYQTIKNAADEKYINYVVEGLNKRNITAITKASANYPEKLKDLPLSPLVLYAKGDVSLLKEPSFAIVGSRRSLPLSTSFAAKTAERLAENGITVITGIAEGVDESVIKAGLPFKKIISVIAGGFDKPYPKKNAGLMESVAASGLILSEHVPEVIPKPYLFPVRNRIIAGLSDGVLRVSAGEKSGALYTAEYAEEYSKPVFAVPYTPGIKSGEGCNNLIKKGAYLCDSFNDIAEVMGIEKKVSGVSLSKEEKLVLSVIREGDVHVAKLAEETGMQIFELMPILSMLEIKKLVVKGMGNVYSPIGD